MELFKVIECRDTELFRELLDAGANVKNHPYLLAYASKYGMKDIVEMLVKAGIDSKLSYGMGLEYAVRNGHIDICNILIDKVVVDWKELNLLYHVKHPEICKLLLSKFVDVDIEENLWMLILKK
jgi:ankyrin repeat protein